MLTFNRTGLRQPKAVTVEPLIDESVRLVRPLLPSSIDLRTHIACNNASIYVDPVQIQQVIINLCINSQNAMDNKEIINLNSRQINGFNMQCTSCHSILQDEFIEFRFKDGVCVVESHTIERIFGLFFTTKTVGEGTGMGLPMVHGIVHQYNEHITVSSLPGQGTAVGIYLPIHDNTEVMEIPENISESSTTPKTPGAHILVIDDDAALATEIHENIGYKVTATTSSQTALKLYQKGPNQFDMVIIAQTMLHMTGLEFAQAMLILRYDLTIILCTGNSADVDLYKIKKAGIIYFLQKPIHTNAFLNSIDYVLNGNKQIQ